MYIGLHILVQIRLQTSSTHFYVNYIYCMITGGELKYLSIPTYQNQNINSFTILNHKKIIFILTIPLDRPSSNPSCQLSFQNVNNRTEFGIFSLILK